MGYVAPSFPEHDRTFGNRAIFWSGFYERCRIAMPLGFKVPAIPETPVKPRVARCVPNKAHVNGYY
jgi:hypothetical protein